MNNDIHVDLRPVETQRVCGFLGTFGDSFYSSAEDFDIECTGKKRQRYNRPTDV